MSTGYFMTPLYSWILNNNHFVLLLLATTRMISICAPLRNIKEKNVLLAWVVYFLIASTLGVTIDTKGEFTARQMVSLGGWQYTKFINNSIQAILFVCVVLVCNIVTGVKLACPGANTLSERHVHAAVTVIIISVIFVLSNALLFVMIARNIKWVMLKSFEPLIPGYNNVIGNLFFRLLMMLNAVCNPVVYFIRN